MDDTLIEKLIDFDKNYIKNFVLETENGTKKVKNKFYKNAVIERNKYINNKLTEFEDYKRKIYRIMADRVNNLMPVDKSEKFKQDADGLYRLENIIKFIGLGSNNYKLGFCQLIQCIDGKEEVLLEKFNEVILEFINKFEIMNIEINVNDFSYSVFTKKYMEVFLNNLNNVEFKSLIKTAFEDIYFECPDILKHLKLNLSYLLFKYKEQIKNYTNKHIKQLLFDVEVKKEDVLSLYSDTKSLFEEEYKSDPFNVLNSFLNDEIKIDDYLEDKNVRKNKFNKFTVNNDFSILTDDDKNKFSCNIFNLEKDLYCLKDYYRYEFIVKDLRNRYSKVNKTRGLYNNKLKEIISLESTREKLYKNYLRANGNGFLAKYNADKVNVCKLKMNEQINKLYGLYEELYNLEIDNYLEESITEVSSLYDMFVVAYSSYYYLEKMFLEHFKNDDDFSLEEEIIRFFKFIYSPNNLFLRKLNGIDDLDLNSIVCDKYKILGIGINEEDMDKSNIDLLIEDIKFITLVYRVEKNTLSFKDIKFIYEFRKFDALELDQIDIL